MQLYKLYDFQWFEIIYTNKSPYLSAKLSSVKNGLKPNIIIVFRVNFAVKLICFYLFISFKPFDIIKSKLVCEIITII